ncbi:MAG: dTDP-4-dehydrorhamnose 3,5-epimerase [Candidatus Parcubacteria bacterium]|nr:dTDP-4-dehydrorhamnose 3,5-epimerase [Burkholderiales bacterium]
MRITLLDIPAAALVETETAADERGLFGRTFCDDEFEKAGLPGSFVQCSTSFNVRRGTLRGMHFQAKPHEEGRLVRCTRGSIYDVVLDLRLESPMFRKWQAFELSADNRSALYVPPGCAHGFQTLEDGSEVFYQMTERYRGNLATGVRWNDPAFAIRWPVTSPVLSPRDANYPDSGG